MLKRFRKNQQEDSDRRFHKRLEFNIAVTYRIAHPLIARIVIGDMEVASTMLNLSHGGMAIITQYNIPEWTKLDLKFRLTRMDKEGNITFYDPVEILGEVCSNIYMGNDTYRLGVCFTKVSAKNKAEMARFFMNDISNT